MKRICLTLIMSVLILLTGCDLNPYTVTVKDTQIKVHVDLSEETWTMNQYNSTNLFMHNGNIYYKDSLRFHEITGKESKIMHKEFRSTEEMFLYEDEIYIYSGSYKYDSSRSKFVESGHKINFEESNTYSNYGNSHFTRYGSLIYVNEKKDNVQKLLEYNEVTNENRIIKEFNNVSSYNVFNDENYITVLERKIDDQIDLEKYSIYYDEKVCGDVYYDIVTNTKYYFDQYENQFYYYNDTKDEYVKIDSIIEGFIYFDFDYSQLYYYHNNLNEFYYYCDEIDKYVYYDEKIKQLYSYDDIRGEFVVENSSLSEIYFYDNEESQFSYIGSGYYYDLLLTVYNRNDLSIVVKEVPLCTTRSKYHDWFNYFDSKIYYIYVDDEQVLNFLSYDIETLSIRCEKYDYVNSNEITRISIFDNIYYYIMEDDKLVRINRDTGEVELVFEVNED